MRAQGLRLSAALLLLSCSAPDPEPIDEPYDGEPFPDLRPQFTLPEGQLGVVSDSGSDTLTLLDLDGRSVIGSAPVGLDPVELDGPHHVAVDRQAGAAFTALSYPPPLLVPGPHAAHGSSQRRGVVQKLSLLDLSPLASVEVDVNPGDIVLSADGSRLVVSHFDLTRAMTETELEAQRADLMVLDAATLGQPDAPPPRIIRSCVAPHGIALTPPGGELAFVACYGEDALAVIDTGDETVAPELISIGPGGVPGSPAYGPYAATLSPDGELVAVSNTASSELRFFEVSSREFREDPVFTPGAPLLSRLVGGRYEPVRPDAGRRRAPGRGPRTSLDHGRPVLRSGRVQTAARCCPGERRRNALPGLRGRSREPIGGPGAERSEPRDRDQARGRRLPGRSGGGFAVSARRMSVVFALGASACSGSPTVQQVSASERGQQAFADGSSSASGIACASCHPDPGGSASERHFPGADLHGATERASFWGFQENDLLEAVNACRTLFQGLPELEASSPEAAALFAFLATLEGSPDPVPFTVVRDIRDLPPGDQELGLSIYDSACRHCHGTLRNGSGRLNEAIPVLPDEALTRHSSYTAEEQRLVFVEKARHGRFFGYGGFMPPFSLEVLPDERLADLLSALELYPP